MCGRIFCQALSAEGRISLFRDILISADDNVIKRFDAKLKYTKLMGSVELPKTTHLPKTTENHLENHIYR